MDSAGKRPLSAVNPLMNDEAGPQHEEISAVRARVTLQPFVRLPMVDQMRLTDKAFPALRARERFVLGVKLLVHDETLLLRVKLPALSTFVWLLARVESLVSDVIRLLYKLLSTLCAREGFLS